jgi:hypothetical protein
LNNGPMNNNKKTPLQTEFTRHAFSMVVKPSAIVCWPEVIRTEEDQRRG